MAAVLRSLPGHSALPNPGGGDCGAYSIGAFVQADHSFVRAAIVSYIEQDATARQPVYDDGAVGADLDAFVVASLAHWIDTDHAREYKSRTPTRAIYCDLMRRPGTFLDDAALLAAALLFRRPVVAHCARRDGSVLAPQVFQPPSAGGEPIVLACELDVHFMAVGVSAAAATAALATVHPAAARQSEPVALSASG
jgi:hypothetical protein